MKHVTVKSKKLPIRAEDKAVPPPCEGLSGKELNKCTKKAPAVYDGDGLPT